MTVTVYSKPMCVQCDATKRALTRAGISYNEVDLSVDEVSLTLVKAMGFQQVPVVTVGDDAWCGFRPDKIRSIAQAGLSAANG